MLVSRSTVVSYEGGGHHEYKRTVLSGSYARDGLIFLGFAILITAMRTYSRWRMVGFKGFQADDFLVWFALALYVVETVNDNKLVTDYGGLTNDGMSDEYRAALSPSSEEYGLRVGGSKLHLAAWPMYVLLLWSLKAAMAVFYLRLMDHLSSYRRKIHIGFALIGVTLLTALLVPFLSCIPTSKFWQIYPDPGGLCYPESSPAILSTILACNIVTDAYLLWLPMPMLFQSTLPKVTKIVLMLLFGCGIFVTAAAAMTILVVVTRDEGDFHTIGFWAARETFVAILTTNLPSIFVLLRSWLKPSLAFLRTASTGLRPSRSTGGGGGGGNGGAGGSGGAGGYGSGAGGVLSGARKVGSQPSSRAAAVRKSRPLIIPQKAVGDDNGKESRRYSKITVNTTVSGGSSSSATPKTPSLPISPPLPSFKRALSPWGLMRGDGGGLLSSTSSANNNNKKSSGDIISSSSGSQQKHPETFSMKELGTTYATSGEKSASQEEFLVQETQEAAAKYSRHHHKQRNVGDAFFSDSSDSGGDDDETVSVKTESGLGARVTGTLSQKVSSRLKRSPGGGSSSRDASKATSANNNHQGGIQKHVEISILEEPTISWGLESPVEAYTVTRAYKEPAKPEPAHHHHHWLGKS